MKIQNLILLSLGVLLIAGCASKPELSRDEQLKLQATFEKNTTKSYPIKTKQEVIDAAQKLLTLSDGDDVHFYHNENGFLAKRSWQWYAVMAGDQGVDQWTIKVQPEGAGSIVSITEITGSSHMPPRLHVKNGLYTLFWRRMDYLLGENKTWTTCEAFEAEMKTNSQLEGEISPLCGTLAKDELPEELRPKN